MMIPEISGNEFESFIEDITVPKNLQLVEELKGDKITSWGCKNKNMLLEGENLVFLKYLLKEYENKINLIYIDPPFGTGNDFKVGNQRTQTISSSDNDKIAYKDNLKGKNFLKFIAKRLILLKKLLSDDGSIYVHIDIKMGHYFKIILDKIFGFENFINDISRIKSNPKNFERKGFSNIKDTILFYSKTSEFKWNGSFRDLSNEEIERRFTKIDENGRRYNTTPVNAPGETKNGATGQEWKGMKPPEGRHWRYAPDKLEELDNKGLIEWSKTGNPRKKLFAEDVKSNGKKRQDIWEFKDPQHPDYPTQKNLELLKVIINASSDESDIVLDAFSGSGTTLIASEKLNRNWIGIDNSREAIKVFKNRYTNLESKFGYKHFKIPEDYY